MHEIKGRATKVTISRTASYADAFLQILSGGNIEEYIKKKIEQCSVPVSKEVTK